MAPNCYVKRGQPNPSDRRDYQACQEEIIRLCIQLNDDDRSLWPKSRLASPISRASLSAVIWPASGVLSNSMKLWKADMSSSVISRVE